MNSSLQRGFLEFGFLKFRLMPWTRHAGAGATSKFHYCVRLCIEGVPDHLGRPGALARLFPPSAFIDDRICDPEKLEEEECTLLWLWTSEPDDIAITATLLAEEPEVLPEEHYADGGAHLTDLGMPLGALRLESASTINYEVIIHVDQVIYYTPLPDSPSHQSAHSDISGFPDDELEEAWPVRHRYVWNLGVPDRRRSPERRRVPVHERLGGRERNRSPLGGGGAGGAGGLPRGFHQMPPSGPHDLPGLFDGRGFFHGSSSQHDGGRHRRQEMQVGGRGVHGKARTAHGAVAGRVWRKKACSHEGKESDVGILITGDSFLSDESSVADLETVAQRSFDPMALEAAQAWPAWPQRSVEPTSAEADPVLFMGSVFSGYRRARGAERFAARTGAIFYRWCRSRGPVHADDRSGWERHWSAAS